VKNFDNLIGIDVDDLRQVVNCFGGGKVAAVKMGMTVKIVARLGNLNQPINGF